MESKHLRIEGIWSTIPYAPCNSHQHLPHKSPSFVGKYTIHGAFGYRDHLKKHTPIGSMYGIYTNIGGILMVNVTIYSIHGSNGTGIKKKR